MLLKAQFCPVIKQMLVQEKSQNKQNSNENCENHFDVDHTKN